MFVSVFSPSPKSQVTLLKVSFMFKRNLTLWAIRTFLGFTSKLNPVSILMFFENSVLPSNFSSKLLFPVKFGTIIFKSSRSIVRVSEFIFASDSDKSYTFVDSEFPVFSE